jgi:DNA-binding MarR family transcriptional regulator
MDKTPKDSPSLGISFFGAVRDLDRVVNSALEKVKDHLRKKDIYGLSVSNFITLQIISEFEDLTHHPLKLAEKGLMNKGAFIRNLENLEADGYVQLTKEDKQIVSVYLTNSGREVGKIVREELNKSAQELSQSEAVKKLARFNRT